MINQTDTDQPVLLIEREHYAIVTLNRPAQLNCLAEEMLSELERILASLALDQRFTTLIINGAGGVFSVGADIATIASLTPLTAREFSRRGQALMELLNRRTQISIAAIDGYCLGGGLDLALACDIRYATLRSSFQHPGVHRGIITGWGGTVRLPCLIGVDAARRLLVTAERIDAVEAERIGLVNAICDDSLARACEMAKTIADRWKPEQIAALKAFCQ